MIGYSSFTGKYQASLRIMGKLVFLGEYRTFKEAEQAVESASQAITSGGYAETGRIASM